jgi:hypothetical protein
MDDIEILALLGAPIGGMETNTRQAKLAELELHARGVLVRYRDAAKKHRENGHYSEQGKRVRVENAAADAIGELDSLRASADLPGIDSLLGQLRAEIANPGVEVRDAAAKLESLWIRDHLIASDEVRRLDLLFKAVETGDARTFSAFVDAPAWLNLVPEEVFSDALDAWGKRHSPEYAHTLGQLERAKRGLENSLATVRRSIASDAGLAISDPIAALANGVLAAEEASAS